MTVTAYSKKKGSYLKTFTIAKDISTMEEVMEKSKEYGNVNGEMTWNTKGFLFPNTYSIK